VDIKTVLKSSVAAAALVAIAAPAANADIKNSNKNSLTVGGYVTKSLVYADDGTEDQLFVTDGGTSESRVRWIASGKLNENVTAGAGIELEIPLSNDQATMTLGANGNSDNTTTTWEIRHQYVWVSHKKFGKLSLGQTNAAANGATEASLSGTTSIDLSGNKTFAQGVGFADPITGGRSASGVTVGGAFTNFDMTSRTDVIRYDAPKFAGLGLSASLNAGGGGEFGAVYSGKFGGVKVLAKAGYSNLAATTTTYDNHVGGSLAVLHDSGINASVSYSTADLGPTTSTGRDDPSNKYVTLGYKAKIFGVGGTNFNFKWSETEDLTANGTEATSIGFTAIQYYDAIGAYVGVNYQNYEYETTTNKDLDDVDVITLTTLFNF